MGLDTTHNCWHGPYSSFGDFRKTLAAQIDIDLPLMEGYGGPVSWDLITHKIKPLLLHSDCDGELSSEECKQIAEGLEEICDEFDESKSMYCHDLGYFQDKIKDFMKGCMTAYRRKEKVSFH